MMGALFGAPQAQPAADGDVEFEEGGIADQPHLTGDPEWDAIEMEETDPTKPPLQVVR